MKRKRNCFYYAHLKLLDSNPLCSQIKILIRFIDFVNGLLLKKFIFIGVNQSISNIYSKCTIFWSSQKDCLSILKHDYIYLNQSLKSNQRKKPIKYKKGGFLCIVLKLFSTKKLILKQKRPGEKQTRPPLKSFRGYMQI